MPRVQAPDGTIIEFPDTMQDADIESAMGKLYPKPTGPGKGGRMPRGTATATAPDPASFGPSNPMGRFAGGVDQMLNLGGNRAGQKRAGLHNAFVGGAEMAAPLALPALAEAPAAVIGGALGGGAGKFLGTAIPEMMHVSPETSELIGDAISIPSAMAGSGAGKIAGPAIRRLISAGIPSWMSDAAGMIHPRAAFLMRGAGKIADAVRSGGGSSEPLIARPSVTGGRTRPDYSGLIRPPGGDVSYPPSSVYPEPGFRTNAYPDRPSIPPPVFQRPPINVPWIDELPVSPSAPAPRPESYVAVPDSGRLVEPWRSGGQAIPSGTTAASVPITSGGATVSAGGATGPKITPGAIPEFMRQQRLLKQVPAESAPRIVEPRGVVGR